MVLPSGSIGTSCIFFVLLFLFSFSVPGCSGKWVLFFLYGHILLLLTVLNAADITSLTLSEQSPRCPRIHLPPESLVVLFTRPSPGFIKPWVFLLNRQVCLKITLDSAGTIVMNFIFTGLLIPNEGHPSFKESWPPPEDIPFCWKKRGIRLLAPPSVLGRLHKGIAE